MAGFLGLIGGAATSGIASGITKGVGSLVGGLFSKKDKDYQKEKELAGWQSMLEEDRMGLQAELNKEQAKYSNELQKIMFDYTMKKEAEYNSPTAQVERLKAAGLNPALMYGGTGTTGSASGSTGGAQAAGISAIQPMGLQIALQAEMQKAQIEALKAQATKTNAEAAEVAAEIESTKSGTKLNEAKTESTKSETKLNEAKFKETLKNIDAIKEKIRASEVGTKEQEFKNKILDKLKNSAIGRYVNGEEIEVNYLNLVWDNELQKALNERDRLSNEERELLKDKEILKRLNNDIEAISQGEIDRLTIPSENKKLLKKQYERNEWELRNDKALGDILNEIGGEDKYSKLLQSIAEWLFKQ